MRIREERGRRVTLVVGGVGSIAQAPALTRDLPYNLTRDLVPLQPVSTPWSRACASPSTT